MLSAADGASKNDNGILTVFHSILPNGHMLDSF